MWAADAIYTSISDRVAAEGPADCEVVFGWRAPQRRRATRRRIAVIPGDATTGGAGTLGGGGPSIGDGVYRSLARLGEMVTVECEAHDPSAPEDELAQYRETRWLYDIAIRAILRAHMGRAEVVSQEWETRRSERRHGALMRVLLELDVAVPDAPPDEDLWIATMAREPGPGIDIDGLGTDAVVEMSGALDSEPWVSEQIGIEAIPDDDDDD